MAQVSPPGNMPQKASLREDVLHEVPGALRPSACLLYGVVWGLWGQVMGGVAGAVSLPPGGPADPPVHAHLHRAPLPSCRLSHGCHLSLCWSHPSRSHVELTSKGQTPSRFDLLKDAATRPACQPESPSSRGLLPCSGGLDPRHVPSTLGVARLPQLLCQVNGSSASG